jgi:uroporphyrin-III C-methyltransferase
VVFITGHAKPGSAGHDWQLLAGTARMLGLTLVIYMGVATAPIIQQLLAGGLPARRQWPWSRTPACPHSSRY